jgi:hypothetical protein
MKRKHLLLLAILVMLAGAGFGLKEYMRGHTDVKGMDAVQRVGAEQLLQAFVADDASASATYVGEKEQAIEVAGTIRTIDDAGGDAPVNVVLETGDELAGIVCEFKRGSVPSTWAPGTPVTLKGICQGYTGEGMMPGDVVLQRCVPVE